MRTHIEVTERYEKRLSESEYDYYDRNDMEYPDPVYGYRLTMFHVDDIQRPAEWEGKKNHLKLILYSGDEVWIRHEGGYQAFAVYWQDLWAEINGDLIIEEGDGD